MADTGKNGKLLWIDLEMTGLDVNSCKIVEAAGIVTNHQFDELDTFEDVVFQPTEVLAQMDEWCQNTFSKNGLLEKIPHGTPLEQVEQRCLDIIDKHFHSEEKVVLAGNSIGQDRKFIDAYMPALAARLHYRMVDVSSFKEIFRMRYDLSYTKKESHRALDDIKESIAELNFFLAHVNVSIKAS